MNQFTAALLLTLALLSGESQAADECCLCNDCDMMMKPDGQVYDIDQDMLIGCSEFAEFIFANVEGSHEICHGVQESFQSQCCMNVLQTEDSVDSDHRSLMEEGVTVPFSRRELQWTVKGGNSFGSYSSFGRTQSWPRPNPYRAPAPAPRWGFSNPSPARTQQITQPSSRNGNALGCTVPTSNNYKTVQVYTTTSSGFSAPVGVNCASASRSGLPSSVNGKMYNVALKCVRCNCCGVCSGTDARVCVGNNQPRSGSGGSTGWSARSGWRQLMESLGLDE